jgi:TatD DNase family protein
MILIDTHCHIDFTIFDHHREKIIQDCISSGIQKILVPSVKASTFPEWLTCIKKYPQVLLPAVGLHPFFIREHCEGDLNTVENLIQTIQPKAIGEIGLDFYDKTLDSASQYVYFEHQLNLAKQYHLPVLIHARKSHSEILRRLKALQFNQGGIIHAFNGSFEEAKSYIALGFKLGFGGAVTYPRARHLRQLARELPLKNLVLETDSPDMPVFKQILAYNTPLNLLFIAQELAKIRAETLELIAAQTTKNALEIIG